MSSSMSSSLSATEAQAMAQYMNTFLDLVDNLPNEISRHLTQLHVLHNNYLKLINKMDINIENYNQLIETNHFVFNNSNNHTNNNSSQHLTDNKRRLAKRIESQLIQMQELSDEKLKYAQIIVDLIESKSKELDFDYEKVLHFNDLINNNNNNNTINANNSNKINSKLSVNSSKTNSNCCSQQSINSMNSNSIEDEKQTTNGENNRNSDKRLLPRRACALKPGEMREIEANYEFMAKLTKPKTIKCKTSKYSSAKSHNFQLSMSNFYRDMARRRAKLPIKIKNNKSVSLALKRNANNTNRKSVPNSNKSIIVANSGAKHNNSIDVELYKSYSKKKINNKHKLNKKKKNSSISSSSSSTTSSSMSCSSSSPETIPSNELNDEKHVFSSLKSTNTSQLNVKKESKRSSNSLNSSSSINNNKSSHNKKSKTQLDNSIDDLFIGEPIDPNEPTYCVCSQVSYGEMICCDNELCQIEWFHFPCVDLVHKPKGKWFCFSCRGDRSNVPKVPKK